MTIHELRVLADAAKAWRPPNNCREHPIVACGACAVCLGAHRAVEDIAKLVDAALFEVEDELSRSFKLSKAPALAGRATRIASYFGSPSPLAAFEAAVMEMR